MVKHSKMEAMIKSLILTGTLARINKETFLLIQDLDTDFLQLPWKKRALNWQLNFGLRHKAILEMRVTFLWWLLLMKDQSTSLSSNKFNQAFSIVTLNMNAIKPWWLISKTMMIILSLGCMLLALIILTLIFRMGSCTSKAIPSGTTEVLIQIKWPTQLKNTESWSTTFQTSYLKDLLT